MSKVAMFLPLRFVRANTLFIRTAPCCEFGSNCVTSSCQSIERYLTRTTVTYSFVRTFSISSANMTKIKVSKIKKENYNRSIIIYTYENS